MAKAMGPSTVSTAVTSKEAAAEWKPPPSVNTPPLAVGSPAPRFTSCTVTVSDSSALVRGYAHHHLRDAVEPKLIHSGAQTGEDVRIVVMAVPRRNCDSTD